jgi:hypothetical protein
MSAPVIATDLILPTFELSGLLYQRHHVGTILPKGYDAPKTQLRLALPACYPEWDDVASATMEWTYQGSHKLEWIEKSAFDVPLLQSHNQLRIEISLFRIWFSRQESEQARISWQGSLIPSESWSHDLSS